MFVLLHVAGCVRPLKRKKEQTGIGYIFIPLTSAAAGLNVRLKPSIGCRTLPLAIATESYEYACPLYTL